ncbi:MAG: hypothetical protein OQK12_02610 [Motiliproteus sp.]|nr:hypothetical protein [Motiliproteus sp.]MCW9053127.1 hypothetical protein [Motiliproteus sp.]
MGTTTVIVAAEKIVDGKGSLSNVQELWEQIVCSQISYRQLTIDPLRAGWNTPLAADHFRSGCAPIEALQRAEELIGQGQARAVLILGKDHLKSDYGRDERLDLMTIYGNNLPITQAYDQLAESFIHTHQLTEALFEKCRDSLFDNYWRTYNAKSKGSVEAPDDRWYQPLTKRFRGVDCANPIIDFEGALLLVDSDLAETLNIPKQLQIRLAGVDVQLALGDGPAYIKEIAEYQHLQLAYRNCCAQANADFAEIFNQRRGLLEVYSCYPVVPMAFMTVSGLVQSLWHLPEWLSEYAVTMTGGMNLARAPWNNPSLNGLITAYHQLLRDETKKLALVHGNGGLGYRQGVALLGRP